MLRESAHALRQRTIAVAELVTGIPAEHWNKVIGAVSGTQDHWYIRDFYGDPTDNNTARRISDEMARHWVCDQQAPKMAPAHEDLLLNGE